MENMQRSPMLAVSLAGHDKGKLYLVLSREADRCLLADGEVRTLAKPKSKNLKHLQSIHRLSEDLKEKILQVKTDQDIREVLEEYERR